MRSSHLRNFQTAISLEVHRISDRPDLFWQQVYNRLQWSGELASGPLLYELEKRTAPGAPPWIRTRMPYRESRYLARTLFGHSGTVNCCAISPDGMSIISGGEDYSVKVWDAATGRLRFDLREHGGPVRACAIGHDGRTFVSGDAEGKLCIWEMASGHLQERLNAGRQEIHGLAVSPKDGLIAAACADGRLRIWHPPGAAWLRMGGPQRSGLLLPLRSGRRPDHIFGRRWASHCLPSLEAR